MNILLTNDDGYDKEGLLTLVRVMRRYGDLTIVAPKSAQSGMSMAVTMGYRPIAVKKLSEAPGERWWYLDGTPASCVKYGVDNIYIPEGKRPDLVVSGINYGANYATAALYSGTIGAAMEAAVGGIPAIAVSLDDFSPKADFSACEALLPALLDKLIPLAMSPSRRHGVYYNVNIPKLPASQIKGVRAGHMGFAHWEDEYRDYDPEFLQTRKGFNPPEEHRRLIENAAPGEDFCMMAGDFTDEPARNDSLSDHRIVADGFISVTPQMIDTTAAAEMDAIKNLFE